MTLSFYPRMRYSFVALKGTKRGRIFCLPQILL